MLAVYYFLIANCCNLFKYEHIIHISHFTQNLNLFIMDNRFNVRAKF